MQPAAKEERPSSSNSARSAAKLASRGASSKHLSTERVSDPTWSETLQVCKVVYRF
jgi:hypothetical protein